MIPVLGTGGPGSNSRISPIFALFFFTPMSLFKCVAERMSMTRCTVMSFKDELPLEYVCAKTITEHSKREGSNNIICVDQTSVKQIEQEMGLEPNTIQCVDI